MRKIEGCPITIKEFIEELSKYPPDTKLCIRNRNEIDLYGQFYDGDFYLDYDKDDKVLIL